MSRAVLLPAIGDPLLSHLWIEQYKRNVEEHVEMLYVLLNSSIPDYVSSYTQSLFAEVGVVVARHSEMITHGEALSVLFSSSTQDLLLLLEDDCFIISRDAVDREFRGIEKDEYDLSGSPRMSCSTEIADIAKARWDLDYEGLGDRGCSFWPNCFFVKRSDLLKTDLDFGSCAFEPGEMLLGTQLTSSVRGDTMVWLSLQLRDLNVRIKEIPQHHCSTYDLDHSQSRAGVFEGNVPWVHTGSSSSLQGLLSTQTNLGLQSLQERKEIERRFAWWLLAYDLYAHILPNDVRKHVEAQHTSLLTFVRLNGLSMDRIKKLVDSYRGLLW